MNKNKLELKYEFRGLTKSVSQSIELGDAIKVADEVLEGFGFGFEAVNQRFNHLMYNMTLQCKDSVFGATVQCLDEHGTVYYKDKVREIVEDADLIVTRVDTLEVITAHGTHLDEEIVSAVVGVIKSEDSLFYQDEVHSGLQDVSILVEHKYVNVCQDFSCDGTRSRKFTINKNGHKTYKIKDDIDIEI